MLSCLNVKANKETSKTRSVLSSIPGDRKGLWKGRELDDIRVRMVLCSNASYDRSCLNCDCGLREFSGPERHED